jgi:cardiolipin synthase
MSTLIPLGGASLSELLAREATLLPVGHARAIASAAERHSAPGLYAQRAMMDAVPHDNLRPIAKRIGEAWSAAFDVSTGRPDGHAIALALSAAVDAAQLTRSEQAVDIVWTGPSTNDVQPRMTPAVIEELAAMSRTTLWVVSFAAYKVPAVVDALGAAADRGVDVRLVLETKDDSKGALTFDAATAFAKIRDRVSVFLWPHDQRPVIDGGHAAMHAKTVIADSEAAFVTSANLTGTALTGNMELGLLVRGGSTPRRLATHFQRLLEAGVFRRVTN